MCQCLLGNFDAAQHSGEFLNSLFFTQSLDSGSSGFTVTHFTDTKMLIGKARHLWQMGHAENLTICADFLESPANHFRDTARFIDLTALNEPAAPTAPDRDADYALLQQALRAAVEVLPERRRAVFELCFLQELTYREAAEALEVSIKTIENQMGHALKTIRKAMEGYVRET